FAIALIRDDGQAGALNDVSHGDLLMPIWLTLWLNAIFEMYLRLVKLSGCWLVSSSRCPQMGAPSSPPPPSSNILIARALALPPRCVPAGPSCGRGRRSPWRRRGRPGAHGRRAGG